MSRLLHTTAPSIGLILCSFCANIVDVHEAYGSDARPQHAQLPLSPERRVNADAETSVPLVRTRATISFEGNSYTSEESLVVLTAAIIDGESTTERRTAALLQLGKVARHLKDRPELDGLMSRAVMETDANIKFRLLQCLLLSHDRRSLDCFIHVLANDSRKTIRLMAAAGLAEWNERSGVREMTRMLGETGELMAGRPLRDHALIGLLDLNKSRAWGFPAGSLRARLESNTGFSNEERMKAMCAEWREWFDANKERFPVLPTPDPPKQAAEPVPTGEALHEDGGGTGI